MTIANELNRLMHKYYKEIQYTQIIKLIKFQMEFLEIAANEGDKSAQYELALLYGESAYFFENPFHNENKQVFWLKKSIDNGHITAKVNLASIYLNSSTKKNSKILEGLSLIKDAYLEGDEIGKVNYEICIKNLHKRNSLLNKSIKQYFKKYPVKKKLFLDKNPDFKAAINNN